MSTINNLLKKLPKSPGIYKFIDKKGEIIYIGKSVNLKSRVNSYFNGKSKLNFAKQKMVNMIENIETIITNNETESLILETTLIKNHQPKYNILMKDGKNHVYIKITNETIPRILKTRIKTKNGTYFGPYTSTNYINNVLKIIKKNFGYRSCNLNFVKDKKTGKITLSNIGNTKIPCIDYYIGRCAGPCLLEKDKIKDYLDKINEIKLFLKGDISQIIKVLEEKMFKHAKELKFEEAEKIKRDIESIKSLGVHQIVREGVKGDFYIINCIEKFEKFYIGMIEIKDSKIIGFYNYDIENKLEEEKEEILKNFVINHIVIPIIEFGNKTKLENIILPFAIDFDDEILKYINIEIPKIGTKKELLDLCYKNIYEYAYKSHLDSLSTKGFSKKTMQNLLNILGYKQINKDIIFECNDISHISGNHTVASRSIIENGRSNTSKYRKLKIKNLSQGKIDDFNSMREVMTRRLKEIEKNNNTPDLIIIDGGKGQLSSVMEIILTAPLAPFLQGEVNKRIQIVSIAKKEEELFLPGESEPIVLNKDSQELRLIQKIRDEAHRFAITFNRDSRIKAMKKNILEEMPGFGPKTRKKLLNKYGNVEKLKDISKEELNEILNKNQIETLENHGII